MAEAPSAAGRETQDRRSAPGSSARQTGVGGAGDGNERTFGRQGGRPRGGGRGGPGKGDKEKPAGEVWIPTTKLGRLVKAGKIRNIETIYSFSLPIKEYQVIDQFLPAGTLEDEVLKIMPVQKQTPSGQRTRFKAFVVVGDKKGHVGLGVKCSKEVATAIRGGIIAAKLSIIPVRLGYWGNKIGAPHTVPTKVTGKCGSVRVRLVPAPRGTGIVAAGTPHKLLSFAGVDDVYTKCQGHTKTLGNFAIATFNAIQKTFEYQTPDLWKQETYKADPYQEFSRELEDLAVESKKDEAKKAARLDDKDSEGGRGERRGRGGFGGDRDFRREGGDREGGGYGRGRGFGGRRDENRSEGSQGSEGGAQATEGGAQAEGQTGGEQSGFGQDRPRREGGFGGDRGGDRGYQRREGGDREGGFGGDRPRREGGGYQRREGGDREGGFGGDRPPRREGGGYRGGDRGDNQGGGGGFGSDRPRREGGGGGYRGGDRGDNQGGGYRGRRDDREGGGFGGDRGSRGFGNSDRPARTTSDQGSAGAPSQSSGN